MDIKEYSRLKKLSQQELTEELRVIDSRIDRPLVSKMINGIVEPSPIIQEYIDKACAHAYNEGNNENSVIVPLTYENLVKGNLEKKALELIQNPISMKNLALCLDQDQRATRELIADMREKGIRIAGDRKGYYICKDEKEYLEFRAHYSSRLGRMFRTLKAMDSVYEGQLEVI